MITIQAEFTQKQCDLGLIGRVGENASRQIVFDCAEALRAFPGADILCIYQRPGEGAPYLAPLSGEKGVYTLVLADTDVALPGIARMELRDFLEQLHSERLERREQRRREFLSRLTPEQQQAIQKLEERMEALSRRNAILRRRLLRAFPEMRSTRYELALERMREALRKKKK